MQFHPVVDECMEAGGFESHLLKSGGETAFPYIRNFSPKEYGADVQN
jgi:hypothetical protein